MYNKSLDIYVAEAGRCVQCGDLLRKSPSKTHCKRCMDGAFASYDPSGDLRKAAQRELALREIARRRLIAFAPQMKPDYHVGWFQKDLAARLERFLKRVVEKKSPRLIINVPPRRGKSELASRLFPAWALGKYPWLHIIAATHSDYLALDNSKDVLGYIGSERYGKIFPDIRLDPSAKGAAGWRIDGHGGRYKPAGAGKGIAGYGAHIFIIDDPHKDREAFSETILESIWKWYKASVRTRLAPGGGIILIQTRWVLNDLTGRVLEEEGRVEEGGVWEQVLYPEEAIHDEYRLPSGVVVPTPQPGAVLLRRQGEVLDPERWPAHMNEEAKSDPVVWAALYQQNPVAGDAAMFKEEWFPECTMADIPKRLTKYTAWDTAVQTKETSAYTVGLVAGVDGDGNVWIIDMIRDRMDGLAISNAILDTYEKHREVATGVEQTNHAVAVQPFIEREIDRRRLHGIDLHLIPHGNKDKAMRARPIQALVRMGKVYVPKDAPWYRTFMDEITQFPVGVYKDIGDALANLGQMLETLEPPRQPKPEKRKRSWRDKLGATSRVRSWRTG